VYLFKPPTDATIQLDVVSKAIDSVVAVYEEGAAEPFARDDNGGEVANARLILRPRAAPTALVVVVTDKEQVGGRFELRAAKVAATTVPDTLRLTVGSPATPGALTESSLRRGGIPFAQFAFEATKGQRIQIDVTSEAFDNAVELWRSGRLIGSDNDSGEGTNSRLIRHAGETGEYTLRVISPLGSLGSFEVGLASVALPNPAGPPVRLTALSTIVDSELTLKSPVRSDKSYATYVLKVPKDRRLVASLEGFEPIGKGRHPKVTLEVGHLGPLGFLTARTVESANETLPDGTLQKRPAVLSLQTVSEGDLAFRVTGDMDFIGKYRLVLEAPSAATAAAASEPLASPQ
jgi:hypothetical protein